MHERCSRNSCPQQSSPLLLQQQAVAAAPSISERVTPTPTSFKLVVLGDGGCGKTTFVRRHVAAHVHRQYLAVWAAVVTPLSFRCRMRSWSSRRDGDRETKPTRESRRLVTEDSGDRSQEFQIVFQAWDPAAGQTFGGVRDGFVIGSDCAMIFCDLTSRRSQSHMESHYRDLMRVCGDTIPIAFVGNKADLVENRKDQCSSFLRKTKARGTTMSWTEVSARSNRGWMQPFEFLARVLLKDPSLELDPPELRPPDLDPNFCIPMKAMVPLNLPWVEEKEDDW